MEMTVIIDFETNGCRGGAHVCDPNHRIIQFAATDLVTGDEFCAPVFTDRHIPQASTAIHGLDAAAIKDAKPFGEVWDAFEAWLRNIGVVEGVSVLLVAHNMFGFDGRVMRAELARCGRADRLVHYQLGDTLPAFRNALPGLAGGRGVSPYSLGALYRHFTGSMFGDSHHALSDVRALREIMLMNKGVFPVTGGNGKPLDGELLTKLRGIGYKRASAIANYFADCGLALGNHKSVGALRAYAAHFGILGLEKVLREQADVFDDSSVMDIMEQVTGRLVTPSIPYFRYFGREMFGKALRSKLVKAEINTRSQLLHYFMYTCGEDQEAFLKAMTEKVGLTDNEKMKVCMQIKKEWERNTRGE